jgi:hypothetical protein
LRSERWELSSERRSCQIMLLQDGRVKKNTMEKHDGSSADSRDSTEALERTRQQRAAAVSENVTPRAETPSDKRRTSMNLKAFRTPLVGIFQFNSDVTPQPPSSPVANSFGVRYPAPSRWRGRECVRSTPLPAAWIRHPRLLRKSCVRRTFPGPPHAQCVLSIVAVGLWGAVVRRRKEAEKTVRLVADARCKEQPIARARRLVVPKTQRP